MAFDDSKKIADKLRIKNPQYFNQGDPTARRDVCWSPWCGNWVEDMRKDSRCHEPECDRRLWQEAVKNKMAIRLDNGTYMGCVEGLLEKKSFEPPAEYNITAATEHMCTECTDNVACPNDVLCVK